MVGPDRTMLSVTKACAYKKVTEGIMRGWISRGVLTKGKIISVNKHSNQRSIVGVYVDELDKIIPKEQKRKILNKIKFDNILKRRYYPSVRTIDILQCPQCYLKMRNLYCIQCQGIPTVPIFPEMCLACGEDLIKKAYEGPDEFRGRHYCNKQCAQLSQQYSKQNSKKRYRARAYRTNPTSLTTIRLKKNIMIEELSKQTGISYATINRIERREIKSSRLEKIRKIADALGVDIKEITLNTNKRTPRSLKKGYMQWR